MGIFFALWRRLFGGFGSDIYKFVSERGVQCFLCVATVFLWETLALGVPWWKGLCIGVLIYVFWSVGHFIYFKCGTEDQAYIEEQFAKGRRPVFYKLMCWLTRRFGLEEFGFEYCFVGMVLRYAVYSVPVSLWVGWHFTASALMIPFIYNACFWVNFRPLGKFLTSATNYGEFFSGLVIGWALL